MTTDDALAAALQHQQAGRFAEAEAHYRRLLAQTPDHPETLHLLGVLAGQTGKGAVGAELIRTAIRHASSQNRAAADLARYWHNLANLLWQSGRLPEAALAGHEAVRLDPAPAEHWWTHCHLLRLTGNLPEAVAAGRQAVQRGELGPAYLALGTALALQGGPDALAEAIRCFQRTLALIPGEAQAENNLVYALREAGRLDESVSLCRQILARRPTDAGTWKNLGLALDSLGLMEQAVDAYQRALALPGGERLTEAWSALANARMKSGDIQAAVQVLERAVAANPADAWLHSNLLYTLHLDPRMDARRLFAAHQDWVLRHARQITPLVHAEPRLPDKRLRVAYLSGDFRDHPVGRFLLPLLREHARQRQVDLLLYSDARFPDAVTAEFQHLVESAGGSWRDVAALSDPAVADLLRLDHVDVLVDLSMHAGHNRMLVLARKPAPVQVTYLAYPGGTGLPAVDWRLSDRFLDPPARDGQIADDVPQPGIYAERTWRLRSYWCYSPPAPYEDSVVAPPPASRSGIVTFGSLNNFSKVSPAVIDLWTRILRETAARGIHSRLLLHASEGAHRQRVLDQLSPFGIAPDRVEFVGWLPRNQYFALYARIDVALDPFPYCGGTTTCDALWMGVPVVTLRAPPHMPAVGRGGASILSQVGLSELVSDNVDQYLRLAVDLAADLPRLTNLRRDMRARMTASPLLDVPGFVRDLEAAYRGMWERP